MRNIYHLTVSLKYTFRPPTRSPCCAALAEIPMLSLTHTHKNSRVAAESSSDQAPGRGSGSFDRDRSQAKDSVTQKQCAMFLCMPRLLYVCVSKERLCVLPKIQ